MYQRRRWLVSRLRRFNPAVNDLIIRGQTKGLLSAEQGATFELPITSEKQEGASAQYWAKRLAKFLQVTGKGLACDV